MNPRTLAAWLRQPVAGTRDMPDTRATRVAAALSPLAFAALVTGWGWAAGWWTR